MGWLGERWSAFKHGVGPRRVTLVASVSGIAAFVVHVANVVHKPEIVPFPIPWVVAIAVVAVSIVWSMVDYTVRLRRQLKGAADLEQALDTLSKYFDEGNNQLFNATVKSKAKPITELGEYIGNSETSSRLSILYLVSSRTFALRPTMRNANASSRRNRMG